MDATTKVTLKRSGLLAELCSSKFHSGLDLVVDDVVQSNVDVDDPTKLNIRYIKHMATMIDSFFPEGKPISVLHLGAGGMSLLRYIGHARPESTQTVVELEEDIIDLVTGAMPLQVPAKIIYGDARDVVNAMEGVRFDLIIADVYSGIYTPEHLKTIEFYSELKKLLAPNGIVLVNSTVEAGIGFSPIYGQYVTVNEVFGGVVAAVDTKSLMAGEEANVLIAGAVPKELIESLKFPVDFRAGTSIIRGDVSGEWLAQGEIVIDG